MPKQVRVINPRAHRPVNWNEAAVQRALDEDGSLIVQVKEDGIRFHAYLTRKMSGNDVTIVTREGIEIRSLYQRKEALRALLQALPDGFVVDGEVVVQGVSFEAGSGLLRAYAAIEHDVKFYVWDTFPMTALMGTEEWAVPYIRRFESLVFAGAVAAAAPAVVVPIRGKVVASLEEAQDFFEQCRENNKEGAVVKRITLGVRNGKVSGQWKLKPSDTVDGIIRGYVWGTPGLGNEGKIIGFTVELEGGVLVDVTGLTQELMASVTAERAQNVGGDSALGRYVEVSYMEKTANGSLRHPSFVKFRDLEYAPGVKS